MPCPVTAAHSASVSGRTDSRETNCQIFTIWSRAGCKSRKNDPNCSTKCSAVTTLLTNQLNSPFFFRSSAPFWKADVPRLFFFMIPAHLLVWVGRVKKRHFCRFFFPGTTSCWSKETSSGQRTRMCHSWASSFNRFRQYVPDRCSEIHPAAKLSTSGGWSLAGRMFHRFH